MLEILIHPKFLQKTFSFENCQKRRLRSIESVNMTRSQESRRDKDKDKQDKSTNHWIFCVGDFRRFLVKADKIKKGGIQFYMTDTRGGC